MPRYKTACFGATPPAVLDASIEAVTAADAADKAIKAHLPGRKCCAARGASINGMHYFAAVDRCDPDDQIIVTVKEL